MALKNTHNKSVLIKVTGRVQGVHFRSFAKKIADKLKITGYAKNLSNGSVEIFAEGKKLDVGRFIKEVSQGSLLAKVESFQYTLGTYTGKYSNFEILRDKSIIVDQAKSLTNLAKNIILPGKLVLPKHIVIIPDGNRRWAKERNLPTLEGHRMGFERFKELAKTARDMGIKTVTIWAFSTENWKRDKKEVSYLFDLFEKVIDTFEEEAVENKIRFRHLGRKDRLPANIIKSLAKLEKKTSRYKKNCLNLALDYGGRDEIIRGIKRLLKKNIKFDNLRDEDFSDCLDTHGIEDPDLIIRTSGEQRLSGMLPWQGIYAELIFSSLYFPDFDSNALKLAFLEYSNRQRRFGA